MVTSTGEVLLSAAAAAKMAATSEAAPTAGKSIVAGERGARGTGRTKNTEHEKKTPVLHNEKKKIAFSK